MVPFGKQQKILRDLSTEQDLLPYPDDGFELWKSYMGPDHLYSEHWLLAYDARVHDWLPSLVTEDYISNDPYFKILSDYSHHQAYTSSLRIAIGCRSNERFAVPWGRMRAIMPVSDLTVGGRARTVNSPDVLLTGTTTT